MFYLCILCFRFNVSRINFQKSNSNLIINMIYYHYATKICSFKEEAIRIILGRYINLFRTFEELFKNYIGISLELLLKDSM